MGKFIPPKNKALHDKVSAAIAGYFAKHDPLPDCVVRRDG